MPASKRLKNHDNLRGTPTSAEGGMGPSGAKQGLRGANMALWAETTPVLNPHERAAWSTDPDKVGDYDTYQTGQDAPATGDNGIGVDATDETLVGRGSQYTFAGDPKISAIPDNRKVLDSDSAVLGSDAENAKLATFTAATGSGAANTFEVTGANTSQVMRVEAWTRGTDTDTDDVLLGVFYDVADGTAKSFTITDPGPGYAAGDTIAVYVREMDNTTAATARSAGHLFATRRTVATHT